MFETINFSSFLFLPPFVTVLRSFLHSQSISYNNRHTQTHVYIYIYIYIYAFIYWNAHIHTHTHTHTHTHIYIYISQFWYTYIHITILPLIFLFIWWYAHKSFTSSWRNNFLNSCFTCRHIFHAHSNANIYRTDLKCLHNFLYCRITVCSHLKDM